jgi:hypothetical protein
MTKINWSSLERHIIFWQKVYFDFLCIEDMQEISQVLWLALVQQIFATKHQKTRKVHHFFKV